MSAHPENNPLPPLGGEGRVRRAGSELAAITPLSPRWGEREKKGRGVLTRAVLVRVALVIVVAVALSGCGKKGVPQPPPDAPNTFPRTYPGV